MLCKSTPGLTFVPSKYCQINTTPTPLGSAPVLLYMAHPQGRETLEAKKTKI